MKRSFKAIATMAAVLLAPALVHTAAPTANRGADGDIRSPGKPGAQVALSATQQAPGGGKAAVARQLDIEIVIALPADAEWLSLAVSPDDALSLLSGREARVATPKGTFRHRVSVVPQAEGRHYLGVSVAVQRDGERRMRAFAVPVVVGAADAVAVQAKRTDVSRNRDGELIVITHSR